MRVLWLTTRTGSPGSVRPDLELARALTRNGIEIHVIAPADSYCMQAAGEAGLEVIGFPPGGLKGRAGSRKLRSYCLDRDIELVHMFDPVATAAGIAALADSPLPLVARHARTGGMQKWNPLARVTVLHPRLARVVCTSEAGRAELARRRDPASVIMIHPGCEPAWYEDPPANLAALEIPADAFTVSVTTDYRARMGIEYIIDAAQWLPQASQGHFLLIGAGHETRSVLERIARSPWRENFHLLGPRVDAVRLTAACAVSVRAALRGEGLPQAIMAAMACGVPPLITDVGGGPELVVQGESGIIVRRRSARALGEALAWLYLNPAERHAMGRAARARMARDFPLARAVAAHLALYRDLSPPPRPPRDEGL